MCVGIYIERIRTSYVRMNLKPSNYKKFRKLWRVWRNQFGWEHFARVWSKWNYRKIQDKKSINQKHIWLMGIQECNQVFFTIVSFIRIQSEFSKSNPYGFTRLHAPPPPTQKKWMNKFGPQAAQYAVRSKL